MIQMTKMASLQKFWTQALIWIYQLIPVEDILSIIRMIRAQLQFCNDHVRKYYNDHYDRNNQDEDDQDVEDYQEDHDFKNDLDDDDDDESKQVSR